MRKNICELLLLLFFVFSFPVMSVAEFPEDYDKSPKKEQMERVRKRVETLRMWKLTKVLDLNEKTSAQLFPLLNGYDRKRAEIERALWTGMKDLRDSLKERRESRLRDILDRLEMDHKALQRINDEERAEVKKILTVEQRAKFVLFQVEFNKEIRRIIAEARDKRQGGTIPHGRR
ncbi:MAG: hypothetical protein OEZ31_02470 [Nitrospirota bacterium]|nr:hypothetical protein [Nitrospirota bacterium]MDH5767811.1 hypothetical protein [Nitrospirota bacterium]